MPDETVVLFIECGNAYCRPVLHGRLVGANPGRRPVRGGHGVTGLAGIQPGSY